MIPWHQEEHPKIDAEREAFDRLTGEFKHFCPDWDGMAIDETCPEADGCSCDFVRMPNG